MDIRIDDLTGAEVRALLEEHLEEMRAITPAGFVHALGVDALRGPAVTFWSAWEGGELAGCAALMELGPHAAEVKSMRTAARWRRRGVASLLLRHLIDEARARGYESLYLETGATEAFAGARALYARHGFETCEAFGSYAADGHSYFMRYRLRASPPSPGPAGQPASD